jgi:hypothetical protein
MPSSNVDIILRARDEATTKLRALSSEIGGLVGTVQRLAFGFGAVGGIIATVASSAGAAVAVVKQLADSAEQLQRASAQTGVGIEPLQAMFKIVKDGGGSTEALVRSIIKLNREIAAGNPLLGQLGIKTKDSLTAFLQLVSVLGESGEVAKVAAITLELLGKTGDEVVPHMSALANETERVTEAMRASGEIIRTDQVPALNEFDQAADRLGGTWKGLWNDMGNAITGPATLILRVLNSLVDGVRGFGRSVHEHTLGVLQDLARVQSEAPRWQSYAPMLAGVEVSARRPRVLPDVRGPGRRPRPGRELEPGSPEGIAEWLRARFEAQAREQARQQAEFMSRHLLLPGFGPVRLPGGPGGIVGESDPFKEVLDNWRKVAEEITASTVILRDSIGAVWDGLRTGMHQVFAGMLGGAQTFKSAMGTIFSALRDQILSHLADLVTSAIFKLFLKLAAWAVGVPLSPTSTVVPDAPKALSPSGPETSALSPAGAFSGAAVGAARGGNTYIIQTLSAKDVLQSLVSPLGEMRAANSRLLEVASAS